MINKLRFLPAVILTSGLFSCTSDFVPEPAPCFADEILPILVSNCGLSGCHNPVDHAEGLDLTTWSGVMEIVKAGSLKGSKIMEVIRDDSEDRMPPAPNAALTQDEIKLIEGWIAGGAPETSVRCGGSCDSLANVSFSGDVQPLLDNFCTGCHKGPSPQGGVNLSNYTGVKVVADNGSLLGSVRGEAGWTAMPWNSARMSECNIKILEVWIQEGAADN